MKLRDYVLRRLLLLIPVLFGVTVITFVISRIVPGDVARAYCGQKCDPATLAAIRERLHLNEPLYVQFWIYLNNLLHGDLGYSLLERRPVAEAIADYFPATFELTLVAMLLATVFGIIFGVVSAVQRDRAADHVTRFFAIAGVSMPIFWLGLMLQWGFAYNWDALPLYGRLGPTTPVPPHVTGLYLVDAALAGQWDTWQEAARRLVLPAVTLAYATAGIILRMTRSSMLEVMGEDYIRTARAKGLSERFVIYKHALRNALIPTVTIIGLSVGSLLGGAVLTETIFAWPGMGRYATAAVLNLDFAAIMGTTLVIAVVYVLANLVVDVMYAFLDPRIRLG